MNERVMQFRVGVMVVATLLICGILILVFDGVPKVGPRPYIIYLRFKTAPGVTDGTPIRKSGIRIGRVQSLQFAEDVPQLAAVNEGGVVVIAEIDSHRTIKTDEIPQIGRSLLGDAFIEFMHNPALRDPQTRQPGDTVVGQVAADPLQFMANMEGDLSNTMRSVAGTSNEIGGLARRVNDLIYNNNEQLVRIVAKTEASLDGIQRMVAHVDLLVGDPQVQGNIKQAAAELPVAMNELRMAIAQIRPAMQKADSILGDVQGITKPLGEKGPQLVESLDRASRRLDTVLGDLSTFTQSINSSDGTIGRLISNPQLYESLNSVASNVNNVAGNLNELTKELRPIVKDVRAFSDKVSRHPESLGVRGALFPSSGIK